MSFGDPKSSSDGVYHFPFWPAPKGSLAYRLDSGTYGWKFNVLFGDGGNVRGVERHWIQCGGRAGPGAAPDRGVS